LASLNESESGEGFLSPLGSSPLPDYRNPRISLAGKGKKDHMNALILHFKKVTPLCLIVSALAYFELLPTAQAVSPAPDGGYPGGNTAEGQSALLSLTSGTYNTAVGVFSLLSLINGSFNTGVGGATLLVNSGNTNTAIGAGALLSNSVGFNNTANGGFTLFDNTTGSANTAIGEGALFQNTIGSTNTAIGVAALAANTTGSGNTVIGDGALNSNTSGNSNIALGAGSGRNVTTASNVICIGTTGQNVNDSFYVGNVFETSIDPDNLPVLIDVTGRLGTQSSSRRFKDDVRSMDKASEAILALRPVTFHYKNDIKGKPQFGLIAEEVAEVDPNLAVRDNNGEIYTVRYDQVNAMLLNEFLKEHRTVQELKKQVAALTATVKEQAALIQKVSDKVDLNRPAPQVVDNHK